MQSKIQFIGQILIIAVLTSLSSTVFASSTLEEKIWFAHSNSIKELETTISKKMIEDKYSVEALYLMSLIQIKYFESQPINLIPLKKSIELANQAFEIDPNDTRSVLALSYSKNYIGEQRQALDFTMNLIKLEPKPDWRLQLSLYFCLQSQDQSNDKDRISLLKSILKQKQVSHKIVSSLLVRELKKKYEGQPLVLLHELKEVHKHFPLNSIAHALAKEYVGLKEYKKADKIFEKINASKNASAESKINHAILLYTQLNHGKKAVAIIKGIQKNNLTLALNPKVESILDVHHGLALVVSRMSSKGDEFIYNYLLDHDVDESTFHLIRTVYRQQNKSLSLIKIFDQLHSTRGKAKNFQMHAAVLSLNLNRFNDSNRTLGKALRLEQKDPVIYESIGYNWYKLKNFREAEINYKKAVKIEPNDPNILYNLACMQSLNQNTHQSLASLKRAVELKPSLIQAAYQDVDLSNTRKSRPFKSFMNEIQMQLAH